MLVDVGLTTFDQFYGKIPKLLEVIGSVVFVTPLVAKPLDVLFDGIDVLHVLLGGVGVVEAQVAHAAVLCSDAEVEADGLGVANVEVTVRLWGKTCLHASAVLAVTEVFFHLRFNEIERFLFFFYFFWVCHINSKFKI